MLFGEGPQIKNIAADLNKLFRQGSLLNQSGQTVEGDSTADQGTADLLAAMDPVIQEISVGVSGEQSARYTVSGTPPLSLPNSLGKPLKAWAVDLLPYQEGTGDPAPDNVRPIHGTDKVTVWTSGKNLLDKSTLIVNSYVTDNGTFAFSVVWSRTGYLELPSGEYVASGLSTGGSNAYICSYDANKQPILASITAIIANTDTTFTIPENGKYVALSVRTGDGSADTAQLEFGSTATEYTPYIAPSSTVITLPQTIYTGTVGSEGGESRWGEVDLGTLNWTNSSSSTSAQEVGRAVQSTVNITNGKPTSQLGNVLCSQYATKSNDNVYGGAIGIAVTVAGSLKLYDTRFYGKTTTEIKEMLSDVQCVYELITPTSFAVPSVTIPTPRGTATAWATAEDGTVDEMSVTYVGKA